MQTFELWKNSFVASRSTSADTRPRDIENKYQHEYQVGLWPKWRGSSERKQELNKLKT
jgi:hypothetical protein